MTITDDQPDQRARSGAPAKAAFGCVVAVVVVWGLVLGLRWWAHPDLLPDHRDGMNADPRPVADAALAAAVTFPGTDGSPTTLTFHDARAVLDTDSAQSQASFAICRSLPGADPIGFGTADLSSYCSSVRPLVDGTQLTYPSPHEYVVVVVTPTRRGTTHLAGVDLDYSLGASRLFRHGTDSVAMDLRVTAR